MTISERYRQIVAMASAEVGHLRDRLPAESEKALVKFSQGVDELKTLEERVGEIPQLLLEQKLSPVLLKAHSHLDRARVLLEAEGHTSEGALIWELEQLMYRLLNDL